MKEGIVSKNTLGAVVPGQFGAVSLVRLGVGRRVLERRAAAVPVRRRRPGQEGRHPQSQTRSRRVGTIGQGGRQPGRFLAVGSIAVDSRGNVYTGEQHHGKRVQKFVTGR